MLTDEFRGTLSANLIRNVRVLSGKHINIVESVRIMEAVLVILIIIASLFVVGVVAYIIIGRSKNIVYAWAESEGYELLECEYCAGRKGPFLLTSSSGQTICRITVKTSDGEIRRGWIKCGGFLFGIINSKTEVVWDK
jgi:hypothetical protein